MDLKQIVKKLQEYAKPHTACDWDNTGLLVEPTDKLLVKKVLVTCDLTEPVFNEALEMGVNLIVSYHPAISYEKPLKRLTQADWEGRSIVRCIENKIAVYSPHTTWDNKNGGINDWIMQAFETKRIESVENNFDNKSPCGFAQSILINLPTGTQLDKFLVNTSKLANLKFIGHKEIIVDTKIEQSLVECEILSSAKGVLKLIEIVNGLFDDATGVLASLRIQEIKKPLMKNVGLGRIGYLKKPMKISDLIGLIKTYLNMSTFRLALGHGKNLDDYVSVVAIGAGCCSGLLNDVRADFIITGEFLHEEIVHEVSRGVSMIVTDHTNTERGYLEIFRKRMIEICGPDVEICVSGRDRDPLVYT